MRVYVIRSVEGWYLDGDGNGTSELVEARRFTLSEARHEICEDETIVHL